MHGFGTRARQPPAAIWLVIKRIALLAAFCEAICRGVLMSGRKLAIPFDRISNSRRAMDERWSKISPDHAELLDGAGTRSTR
jgi:hypothetical protein